jgi:hypothetical protein
MLMHWRYKVDIGITSRKRRKMLKQKKTYSDVCNTKVTKVSCVCKVKEFPSELGFRQSAPKCFFKLKSPPVSLTY